MEGKQRSSHLGRGATPAEEGLSTQCSPCGETRFRRLCVGREKNQRSKFKVGPCHTSMTWNSSARARPNSPGDSLSPPPNPLDTFPQPSLGTGRSVSFGWIPVWGRIAVNLVMLFERQRLLLTLLDGVGEPVGHTDFRKGCPARPRRGGGARLPRRPETHPRNRRELANH